MLEAITKKVKDTSKMFKKEDVFTAEKAWVETTYGSAAWKPLEKRISEKQKQIKDVIRRKYGCNSNDVVTTRSYRCVIDIEEDLKNNVDEILQPFKDGGFDIINLSERIPEIYDENVYLISWRHVFDKKRKDNPNKEQLIYS